VLFFEQSGKVTRNITEAAKSTEIRIPGKSESIAMAFILPVLIWFAAVITLVMPADGSANIGETYGSALAVSISQNWPGLLLVIAIGIAAVVFYVRRQKSYGLSLQPGWMIFLFLCGWPGYLGYLWHRHWPARLPCPTCHATVPRDRLACTDCGAEFPIPPRKGIEVFA
jgi:hypothetical protein